VDLFNCELVPSRFPETASSGSQPFHTELPLAQNLVLSHMENANGHEWMN
jgi:hypothetical protein